MAMVRDARRRFEEAVIYGLILGSGTFEDRLVYAISRLAMLNGPLASSLPEFIQKDFVQFWDSMTLHESVGDEGKIAATVGRLDYDAKRKAAEKILTFYIETTTYIDRMET